MAKRTVHKFYFVQILLCSIDCSTDSNGEIKGTIKAISVGGRTSLQQAHVSKSHNSAHPEQCCTQSMSGLFLQEITQPGKQPTV